MLYVYINLNFCVQRFILFIFIYALFYVYTNTRGESDENLSFLFIETSSDADFFFFSVFSFELLLAWTLTVHWSVLPFFLSLSLLLFSVSMWSTLLCNCVEFYGLSDRSSSNCCVPWFELCSFWCWCNYSMLFPLELGLLNLLLNM